MNDALKMSNEAISKLSKGIDPASMADMVWEAYSKLEHAVILLKLDLGDESSQRQESLKEDPLDIGGLLVKASDSLANALDNLSSDFHEALMDARSARDALRSTLIHIKKGNF